MLSLRLLVFTLNDDFYAHSNLHAFVIFLQLDERAIEFNH
jgi:hypothetical protein